MEFNAQRGVHDRWIAIALSTLLTAFLLFATTFSHPFRDSVIEAHSTYIWVANDGWIASAVLVRSKSLMFRVRSRRYRGNSQATRTRQSSKASPRRTQVRSWVNAIDMMPRIGTVQALVVWWILIFGWAVANSVEPPGNTASPAPNGSPGGSGLDAAALDELRVKREKAAQDLKAAQSSGIAGTATGATDLESETRQERRSLLQQILRGYDEQIDEADRLQESAKRLVEVERASAEWEGFQDPPPYSILFADQLWSSTLALRLAVEGLQSQLGLIALRADRAREFLQVAEEQLRKSSERSEAAVDSAQAARLRAQRELDELRKRAVALRVAAAEASKQRVEQESAETRARLAFVERQLAVAEQRVSLEDKDLDAVRTRNQQERQHLEDELERTVAERALVVQALQTDVRQEEQLSARLSSGAAKSQTARRVEQARQGVELRRARLDNLVARGDLLKQLLDVVEGERQLWESRFAIARDPEPGLARRAYARFVPLFANFSASRDHLRHQLLVTSGQVSELDNRLAHASKAQDRRHIQELLQVHRQREAAYNRSLQRMDDTARLFERWRSQVKDQRNELPLSARIEDWIRHGWTGLRTAWGIEVFSAEDTIEVDGKRITGHRSVTLGKIVSALVLLLVGYWLCLYLARVIGRLAVTRFGLSAGVANLIRQWSQAFLITMVIVISLVSVKIPLTIFAFLGGAFAIGVGFGAQNLLKNVISGILVLIERPLRVGDLIEVDHVRGRVTTIGLRSSTVRDAKGMDTLIPNSSFLERHLTNWTYSSRQSRFSLRLGVPYGSSTPEVIALLTSVGAEHEQILKEPGPQVLLEEFGAQARIFALNYWLEIRPDIDPNEVASELRFAIEDKFLQAGWKVLPAA